MPKPAPQAVYLYAIADDVPGVTLPARGLGDAPVRAVTFADGLVAVVSDWSAPRGTRLRPERRHLAAHQNVLRELTAQRSMLPVSFGMVAESQGRLSATLSEHAGELLEQLARVGNRVEMALRLAWDVPNVFAHLVERHAELKSARDRVVRENSHESKMAAGRMFEAVLASERQTLTDRALQIVEPAAVEVIQNSLRGETQVFNLACLVERGQVGAFEQAVHRAAESFDDSFRFDLSGPWAPHSFVKLDIGLAEGTELSETA